MKCNICNEKVSSCEFCGDKFEDLEFIYVEGYLRMMKASWRIK